LIREIGCPDCRQLSSGDCGKHGNLFMTSRTVHRCPVCEGRGYVPNGFYRSFAGSSWTTTSIQPETCKSCEGKGYVAV
jgi:hypothetical protein